MRTHTLLVVVGVASLLTFQAPCLMAQTPAPVELSPDLQSTDWTARRDGFARLVGVSPESYVSQGIGNVGDLLRAASDDQVVLDRRNAAFADLLTVENAHLRESSASAPVISSTGVPGAVLSEAYVNYYGDVVAAVSATAREPAIPSLLGAITTGNMAVDALVSLGTPSVAPVAELIESPDSRARAAAALTLSRILASVPAAVNGTLAELTKNALIKASNDSSPIVRMASIDGLVVLGDYQSIEQVNRLAYIDPYVGAFGATRLFPVRNAALEALAVRTPAQ